MAADWRLILLAGLAATACSKPLTKTEQLAEACFMDQMGTRQMCSCMASAAPKLPPLDRPALEGCSGLPAVDQEPAAPAEP